MHEELPTTEILENEVEFPLCLNKKTLLVNKIIGAPYILYQKPNPSREAGPLRRRKQIQND
jgi:hypothetical protein